MFDLNLIKSFVNLIRNSFITHVRGSLSQKWVIPRSYGRWSSTAAGNGSDKYMRISSLILYLLF